MWMIRFNTGFWCEQFENQADWFARLADISATMPNMIDIDGSIAYILE